MELSWPVVGAAALALVFVVMIVRGRRQQLTADQRARARRFLAINERVTVAGAALWAVICAVGAVATGVMGEWRLAALFLGGVVLFVTLGFGQRWWHRRELGRLDEG